MKNGWTEVALGEVLTQIDRTETVRPEKKYRLLGVRLEGRGAFHRETKLGTETSATSLNRVENGDFIYSRLYAWKGAFSMIGEELDGCYVSNEFPLFSNGKDSPMNLDYLRYWFRLPKVWKTVEDDCQGSTPTTRNRFKEDFFLKLKIPLPPFSEQERIVAHLDAIEQRLNHIQKLREESEKELLAALRSVFHKIESTANWLEMAEVAPLVRRPVEIEPDGKYPELGIRSFGRGTFHKPPVLGLETTKHLYEIHEGDLVFNNVFAWEGAIAVAQKIDHGRVGSHRFITCLCEPNHILPEILQFYFQTRSGLEKIGKASPGGAGRNRTLGLKRLEKILVPVPPISKQQEFLSLLNLRSQIQEQHANAIIRQKALIPSLLDQIFND